MVKETEEKNFLNESRQNVKKKVYGEKLEKGETLKRNMKIKLSAISSFRFNMCCMQQLT